MNDIITTDGFGTTFIAPKWMRDAYKGETGKTLEQRHGEMVEAVMLSALTSMLKPSRKRARRKF